MRRRALFCSYAPTPAEEVLLHRLQNSSYAQAGYAANNFNDLGSGFVTLFELLVVNNWFVIAEGFELATGSKCAEITIYIVSRRQYQ